MDNALRGCIRSVFIGLKTPGNMAGGGGAATAYTRRLQTSKRTRLPDGRGMLVPPPACSVVLLTDEQDGCLCVFFVSRSPWGSPRGRKTLLF